ncbi:MAG: hypothetical protein ACR2J8_04675, partial [Thermomicrobiales bacterium]
LTGGRAHVVRYEALHADASGVLQALTGILAPVPTEAIQRAIDACRADVMRQRDQKMQRHIRSGKVGESRQELGQAHLDVFRDRHATQIRALGYQVR